MGSHTREADLMTRKGGVDESTCPMVLLPPEIKDQIMFRLRTQKSLSSLSRSCRAWYGVANEELYKRDSRENNSFAIKWMAAHAVDDQTTDSALRTLKISRRWGGQIDAVKRRFSRSDKARLDKALLNKARLNKARWNKYQLTYETSTALHFAIFLGNMRLTETLLDTKASLEIPCSNLLRKSMGSQEFSRRFSYFQSVFWNVRFGLAFPIFLAFLNRDPDMCKLLIDHGAGREAINVETFAGPKVMSVLHFAAADRTTNYRQWQCLFHGFREYIDEPSPTECQSTPLHIALKSGCTQGMQIAVESGADKEARDAASRMPLSVGILGIPHDMHADPKTFEERTMCFRKFVELGASVNSEGASILVHAVLHYASCPVIHPLMRHLIYFLLDNHADIHGSYGTLGQQNTNVVSGIVKGLLEWYGNPPAQELLKDLLNDLVDRGLNLTMPVPGLPSPLYRVLSHRRDAELGWLLDLFCENGATIFEDEVSAAFHRWCVMPRLWRMNQYDAWWQHQGQEEEIFLKWCKHPYNVWWWQHVKHISSRTVELAYGEAFFYRDRKLYDILTHLPLPAPSDDVFVKMALISFQPWSWSLAVQHEFEEDFRARWLFNGGENMIHITVRYFIDVEGYSAADASRDILFLRDKGMDMIFQNREGKTPLDILLGSDSSKDGFMKVVAVLEGEVHKVQELA